MDRITSTALCQYRENQAAKSHEHFNRYAAITKIEKSARTVAQTHEMHIALHKSLLAADDAIAAHKLVCGENNANVVDSMLPGIFTMEDKRAFMDNVRQHCESVVHDAYEYFENQIEDAALSKFHRDAFGE
jgi:hypothetical protein